MKPQAIKQFEMLYLGGYAVAIVGSFLGIGAAQHAMAATGLGSAGGSMLYGSIVFSIVVALLLWFFIARRHSNVAKWIAVVLVLLGLLSELRSLTGPAPVVNGVSFAPDQTALIIGLVGAVLEAVGLSRLFTPAGKAWFATRADGYAGGDRYPPEPPYPPRV